MRRKDREITDINEKLALIKECKVCRLGLSDNDTPYIVPLNYGFTYQNDKLTLFFHSANEGKKLSILRRNPHVCFEIDSAHKLITADTACKYGFSFVSIIGFGNISFIEEKNEKIQALDILMRHQTGKDIKFSYNDAELDAVTVYKMNVTDFSGKRR